MTITTVGELLALLEDKDPSTPIMIAHQPAYPIAETLAAVVDCYDRDDHDIDGEPEDGDKIVWLVAGGHAWDASPYAPDWVFEAVPQ